jgi:hypothetical protein
MQKIGVIDKSFEKNSSLLGRECTNFKPLDYYCDEKEKTMYQKTIKNMKSTLLIVHIHHLLNEP